MSNAQPIRVAVTGAGGQIGYSLLFRIASGEMLGPDQPVILHLIDLPQTMPVVDGVVMELADCAFPLLHGMVVSSDPQEGFGDCDIVLLVGARPRSKGMERSDLLTANGQIFTTQGEAIARYAKEDVRVLVVGNPCNTNALIAVAAAKRVGRTNPRNYTAMLRLDHNRAASQLAQKLSCPVESIERLCVWGNHSPTMYPDVLHATVMDQAVKHQVDETWLAENFIPTVGQRGAAVIAARGLSSAASAANAAIDHVRDWWLGTDGRWVSMGVLSDGEHGVPAGLVFGYPCVCENGTYRIIDNLQIDTFSRHYINKTIAELESERDAVHAML